MSYRDFRFPEVIDKLGLSLDTEELSLGGTPVAVPPFLAVALASGMELVQGLNNEKARSEFLIAPMLLEVRRLFPRRFGLFSGTELNVDAALGLNGVCDFLISKVPMEYVLRAPIVAIAEAKNGNVNEGFGQCIAAMHAAALFNQKANAPAAAVYGVSTTGAQWKFLRLVGAVVTIDTADYFIDQPERVLGALARVIEITTA